MCLGLSNYWRKSIKAIVLSYTRLAYLPLTLRENVMSLQISSNLEYSTFPYCSADTLTSGSLYTALMEIIDLIGKHSTFIVYVEFQSSSSDSHKPLHYHMVGFLKTIKGVQSQYSGIIVPYFGLTSPKAADSVSMYEERKYENMHKACIFLASGLALGVPVATMLLQNHHPDYYKLDGWAMEPLFSSQCVPQREILRRISEWFRSRTMTLLDTLPEDRTWTVT